VTRLRVGVGFGECAGDIASTRLVRTIYEIHAIYGYYARLSRLGSFTLVAASIAASASAASTLPTHLARCRAREVDFPGEQRPKWQSFFVFFAWHPGEPTKKLGATLSAAPLYQSIVCLRSEIAILLPLLAKERGPDLSPSPPAR
jgi:hypothetical protein